MAPLLLDLLLLRQGFLELLAGDQFLIDENLADALALVEIVKGTVDLFLRDADLEEDLAEVLAGLFVLDLQRLVQLFLPDEPFLDQELSQGLIAARL